ncbi:MAG: hypothetical protein ABW061_23775, partial [Polyangiaceae bacterium]
MKRRRWCTDFALAVALSLNGAAAHAEGAAPSRSVQECAQAYENSQEHRRAGALSSARSEFARCEQADCPEFIRIDCARWSKEAELAQPTVVFSAKRGALDLSAVRVSVGERVLVERLQGQAVELDPGEYDFQFETAGSATITRHAVVRAVDKEQLVQVEFAGLAESSAAFHPAGPSESVSKPSARELPRPGAGPPRARSRVLPWTLLAFGAASLGTGVGLSLWGRADENRLR